MNRWICAAVSASVFAFACKPTDLKPAGNFTKRGAADNKNEYARKVGEITDLHNPESVRYDGDQDVFFISNIQGYGSEKDGHGFILRVDAADYTKNRIFAQGGKGGVALDAPKGMAIQADTLWVVDIDVLRGFDRHTGAPVANIDLKPQGAVLLNDIALGPDNSLMISDTGILMSPKGVIHVGGDKLFQVMPDKSVKVVQWNPKLEWPNGVTWDPVGKRWIVVNFDPFTSTVSQFLPSGDISVIGRGVGRFDGVEVLPDGKILVASWVDSAIHRISGSTDEKIIRHLTQPADIGYDTKRRRVLIPLSGPDAVQVWQLTGK